MSLLVTAEMLCLVGRLMFDIVKWAKDYTPGAELNRELNSAGKKHQFVADLIRNKVRNYDTTRFDKLPMQSIADAKNEAMKHIDRHIVEVVDTKHQVGEFVR